MKSHMLFVSLIVLLLCGLVAAQDYDILGNEACETIIHVMGQDLLHVDISQNDAPLASFDVLSGEDGRYTLPAGVRSYRVAVQGESTHILTIDQKCPQDVAIEAADYATGSPEDKDAWLLALYAQVPAPFLANDYVTLDFLRQMAEGDPQYGYGPQAVVSFVNDLISLDQLYHDWYTSEAFLSGGKITSTPAPTESPTAEPTAEATQELN